VPKPRPQPPTESQLGAWKLLERFIGLLDKHGASIAPHSRETHGLRLLDRRTYFGLFLFGLFNPVVSSMRGLCGATRIKRVAGMLGRQGPVAISGFSEAQNVFTPDILEPVMRSLLAESLARQPAGLKKIGRITPELIHIFDSTVWKVVTRMKWADWRHQNCTQQAVRLHIKLRLADCQPGGIEISEGKICERAAMRRLLKPGEFYLGDRNYGADHGLFAELDEIGCGHVLRLNNTSTWQVVENHPLPPAAVAGGILLDAMVLLGHRGAGGIRRVIVLRRPGMKEDLILVTSEPPEVLSALEVTDLYRHRWQVEIFFRWLKCLVPCRHWFAESRAGVSIQIYLCLIKALLLAELTGRKPNKRMMELLHWHQLGMVCDDELAKLLAAEESARQRRSAALAVKKSS
jgi:hypothetical protein